MKKAKDILKKVNACVAASCKKACNIHVLTRFVLFVAIAMVIVAACVVLFYKPVRETVFVSPEIHTLIDVKSGDTLSKILTEQGFSMRDVNVISQNLKKDADFTTLRPGRDKFDFVRPKEGEAISKIVIENGPWNRIEIDCGTPDSWQCQKIQIERDTRIAYKEGEIAQGSSFYLSAMKAGIPEGLILDVYDLLAFEMDFERDIRAGQKFYVLYEENFASDKKVDNGHVLAVSFDALRGNVQMYRYVKPDGHSGYYDEHGNGAIKSLKRTPINNAKVTSNFSKGRKHPVLGFTRAHKGVDFRAPTGTPIPAAGAGRVIARSFNRGHGNFVKIRHNGTFETLYAHMSKFAKGVKVGTMVRQGQIIGYSGSTGLSTGPHLHYEIIKNGVHVNPMTVKLPAIDNLDAKNKKLFMAKKAQLDATIESLKNNPSRVVRLTDIEIPSAVTATTEPKK
ncbi:MAG: peptidoglycan DD-metalloendopeptidase family protein [Alphaproteobacteria bacterium]|nr:peptidoglycan DD-metalloendopeptidase family protein [Alphaproteobacteria bacterium]